MQCPLKAADATAGLRYADGTQAFACSAHFRDYRKLILDWIDFIAEQRHRLMSHSIRLLTKSADLSDTTHFNKLKSSFEISTRLI